jgi:transcriptional regulator with XRE-family HTH domain
MIWLGDRFKEALRQTGISQAELARRLDVSRQTVVDWTKGQVPKGTHLLGILELLDVDVGLLFAEGPSPVQVAPKFRTRRNAKTTKAVQDAARKLASDYAGLLAPRDMPVLEQIVRRTDEGAAEKLAMRMRELSGLDATREPMDYPQVFRLMAALGICVILRPFPKVLKNYAFYTVINSQRVVFVNSHTNVLDVIFPMLHETVHALRDAEDVARHSDEEEDEFCDRVAGLVQFPDGYVDDVYSALKGRTDGVRIILLKEYATRNHHAVYGLSRRIQERHGQQRLGAKSVHGADGNLRKDFPSTLSDKLLANGAEGFVNALRHLCPIWYRIVLSNVERLTTRKLAEVLGLESALDAKEVRDVLIPLARETSDAHSLRHLRGAYAAANRS